MDEFCQFKIENVYTLTNHRGSAKQRSPEKPTTNFANHLPSSKDEAPRNQVLPKPYYGTGRKPLDCDRCGKVFYRKTHLLKHILSYKYPCSICAKPFRLKRELIVHAEEKHGHLEQMDLYTCTNCSFKTPIKSTLRDHILQQHTNNFSYHCKICQKRFKVKCDLNHHMRDTHYTEPTIKCSICNAPFKNDTALLNHMRSNHDDYPYQCTKCKRYLATPQTLEHHMQWHAEKKSTSITCPKCGKVLRGRTLAAHLRVHTDQKPYTCPVCGKCFRRLSPMERHVVIHTGKKPYVCDVCGQMFAQRPGLLSHRKRHPGPLPPLPVVSIKNIVREFIVGYNCVKHETIEIDE